MQLTSIRWKRWSVGAAAIGNVLTRIVTAPLRALGSLFGISGDKLEAVDFDPGSDKLLPPEREKLKQVGQMLSRRSQRKRSVPGQYSEATDRVVLKARALRVEIAAPQPAGVAPASVMATAPEQVSGEPGKPVTLKLGLTAK